MAETKFNLFSNILWTVNTPTTSNFKPPIQTTGGWITAPIQPNNTILPWLKPQTNAIPSKPVQQPIQPIQQKPFIPTPVVKVWTQANASEKNLIQTYLDDDNEDVNNREQIFKMIQNWEDETLIEDAIVNKIGYTWIKQEQWFDITPSFWEVWQWAKDVWTDVKSWLFNLWADVSKWVRWEIWKDTWIPLWLFWRTMGNTMWTQKEIKDIWEAYWRWEITKERALLQNMWMQWLLLSDTLWDVFMSWLKTIFPNEWEQAAKELTQWALSTETGQKISNKIEETKKEYERLKEIDPNKARDYKASLGWLSLWWEVSWYWSVSKTAKWIKEWAETVIDTATPLVKQTWKQVLDKSWKVIKQWVEKTAEKVWQTTKWIKTTKEQITSWLTKEEIKGFQSNPYQADEFKKLTNRLESPEWISDIKDYIVERVWAITKELTDEIDKIRATKWETSNVYKEIRKQPIEVKTETLLNDFKTTIEANWMKVNKKWVIERVAWSKAKDLNQTDISKLNQLYNDIKADSKKWYLTPDEILTFRKTASDLAKYDASTTTTGQGIIRWLRKNIDNTAKEQITWLKELDSQFVDKLDEFENAVKDLVYKWWDVKWEWRSNIVNIIWTLDRANRAKLLTRLDDVIPWIWEKIQAIDNIPTILKSLQSKWMFEKYTWVWWAIAWASVLWSAVPVLWHIAWAIVWWVWWKLLESWLTGIRKIALNKVLSKISNEWAKRMKEINTKIAKKQLLKQEDKAFINSLKQQFNDEISKSKTNNLKSTTTKSMTSGNIPNNSNTVTKKLTPKVEQGKLLKKTEVKESNEELNELLSYKLKILKEFSNKNELTSEQINKTVQDFNKIKNAKVIDISNWIMWADWKVDNVIYVWNWNFRVISWKKSWDFSYTDLLKRIKETTPATSEIQTKLSKLNSSNIEEIAKSITTDITKLAKVKQIIQEHLNKYGAEFKNYMAELVEKISDYTWTKLNLLGKEWIGVEKTKLLTTKKLLKPKVDSLIEEVWAYNDWFNKWKLFDISPQSKSKISSMEIKADMWEIKPEEINNLNKWFKDNKDNYITLYHWTYWWHDIIWQWLKATKQSTAKSLQSAPWYVNLSFDPSRARTFWEFAYPWKEIKVYKVNVKLWDLKPDLDQLWNKRYWGESQNIWNTLADSLLYWKWFKIKWNIEPYKIKLLNK